MRVIYKQYGGRWKYSKIVVIFIEEVFHLILKYKELITNYNNKV